MDHDGFAGGGRSPTRRAAPGAGLARRLVTSGIVVLAGLAMVGASPSLATAAPVAASVAAPAVTGAAGGTSPFRVDKSYPLGQPSISSVSCPSSDVCFAVGALDGGGGPLPGGDGPLVLATTNATGADSWTQQQPPSAVATFAGLSCPTTSTCVAVGTTIGNTGFVVTTTNGGATWSEASIPASLSAVRSVSCPKSGACFALAYTATAETVITAADPSGTWTAEALPAGDAPTGLSCATATTCWAVGSTYDIGTEQYSSQIIATTDGGAVWTQQTVPPNGGAQLTKVSCPTVSTCWASGEVFMGPPVMLATTDGGATWVQQTIPGDLGVISDLSCPTSQACEAPEAFRTSQSSPFQQRVLVTRDGGATWGTATIPAGVGLGGISCPSATECVAGGSSIIVTTDGAASFSRATLPFGQVSNLAQITCPSTTTCLALGNSASDATLPLVVATTDKGGSWHGLTLPADVTFVSAISCPSTASCYAAGATAAQPVVLVSKNGGATWRETLLPRAVTGVSGVSCPNVATCVAVGTVAGGPSISTTTNSGRSWSERAVPAAVGQLGGVDCPTTTACYSTGSTRRSKGLVIASANSGTTWKV
ncbi:MAG: hypothetical protein M3011_06615, partial [Actinomycetota bacterium]|nr:hypothetical protein [Actinomycetota bacterium]